MIKVVVFDLDDTLYDYTARNIHAMKALQKFACEKFKLSTEEFDFHFESARKSVKIQLGDTASSHNRLLYMQMFLESIGKPPVNGALEMYDVYWNNLLWEASLFPYVRRLFEKLERKGIRKAILTDLTAHIQHRKLACFGLENEIDFLVTSEEVGVEKPSICAFHRILDKIGCKKDEVLMIGDSQSKDIEGAKNVGMHALLFSKENMTIMDQQIMEYIHGVD